jgi:hypothetical protein
MWAALLTVATLSLLTSSAFSAYATYRYFTSVEEPDVDYIGVPSIAPDEAPTRLSKPAREP